MYVKMLVGSRKTVHKIMNVKSNNFLLYTVLNDGCEVIACYYYIIRIILLLRLLHIVCAVWTGDL